MSKKKASTPRTMSLPTLECESLILEWMNESRKQGLQAGWCSARFPALCEDVISMFLELIEEKGHTFPRAVLHITHHALQTEARLFSLLPYIFLTLPTGRYLAWKHHKGILEKSLSFLKKKKFKFNENISMH